MEQLTLAHFGLEPFNPRIFRPEEVFWREHQRWFQDCGYMLRPRYMPDWKPSWPDNVHGMEYEDAQPLIMHPSRLCLLPRFTLFSEDVSSMMQPQLASDPLNYCVPILKVPEDNDMVILVMPLLRDCFSRAYSLSTNNMSLRYEPYFSISTHESYFFRDISVLNILMDGSMYTDGWHPCNRRYMRDNFRLAKHFSRTERPPMYYFIDFGISCRYGPDDKAPLELPIRGGDKTVPEFIDDINLPRNPFQTDIYYVGNLIRESVIDEYKSFDVMWPLISDMIQDDPAKRPTIDQVVKRFADMCKKLGTLKLRAGVGPRDESFGVVRDFFHLFTTIKYTLKGIPPVPTR
ncbi:hypothetical protein PILCRDRAFT_13116 [Piloderma croceum F 1598]|uniref:Protein kinase domain-containing protein n=1 Tax=Piloderma croceum (strain F 1598) TaxID=765440 RepID=A0A0C3BF05_PILCF|nr:hypothetical protein PILCRDRAFT_13116 [Piloderma croceum F 1598]